MVPETKDICVRTVGGCYIAWSLDVPSQWGEWTIVDVLYQKPKRSKYNHLQIVPRRPLEPEEIWSLRVRPLVFWGMKVSCAPWAFVMCREVNSLPGVQHYNIGHLNPLLSIGV